MIFWQAATEPSSVSFHEHYIDAADGVRIYARDYRCETTRTPVLCLPGLTRNAKDFETIASLMAAKRRVVCIDFRGRGRSSRGDPATYRPDVELSDTLALLDHLNINRVAVLGTSRGGIVALLMAAQALHRMAGVAFNDIGPRIDKAGLLRIRSYLGSDPKFTAWDQAVTALKLTNPGFPSLPEEAWMAFARRVFRDDGGLPRADFDVALLQNFPTPEDINAGKVPELWELLDLLSGLPTLVLRGEHSDLLSHDTVMEMQARLPGLAAVSVKERGHVPFLDEPESLGAIAQWLAAIDARESA